MTVIRGNRFIDYGPDMAATVERVWPKPFSQYNKGFYFAIDPNNFELVVRCSYAKDANDSKTII